MNDICKTKKIIVEIQENGIIRRIEEGFILGRLLDDISFDNSFKESYTSEAIEIIKQAMIDDDPLKQGSYAHSWHCNIAMVCFDAMISHIESCERDIALKVGNDAASRFMKLCFDVETKE